MKNKTDKSVDYFNEFPRLVTERTHKKKWYGVEKIDISSLTEDQLNIAKKFRS